MNLLPTENSKYKMFVMNAQEYMDMKEKVVKDKENAKPNLEDKILM